MSLGFKLVSRNP